MKHKIKKIHFIGIGGVGMSGIAEVLHHLEYAISGSDISNNYNTDRLHKLGINIYIGHHANNIKNVDAVVTSTAIDESNVEIIEAKKHGIMLVPRAQMLAELMRFKYGIAIAGTHGKTTTTSLCAEVFTACGLDPTYLIGGKLAVSGANAQLGKGEYLIAEADESDASFLYLSPLVAVVTNIDLDHMATYNYDENELKKTFVDFLHRLPFYGIAILCNEDIRVREIIPSVNRKIITYGLSAESDIYASNVKANGNRMSFDVHIKKNNKIINVDLNLVGEHNVLNALAVIAVSLECECNIDGILKGLSIFHGVGRRCQHYPDLIINNKAIPLIDDYGHHPNEIKATLSALKNAYLNKRLVLIFQPHRYTRTRDLFDDFMNVLPNADILIITEIYGAGEEPIPMIDGRFLVKSLHNKGVNVFFANDLECARDMVYGIVKDGDLVLTMGAGSIGKLPQMLIEGVKND